MKEFDKITEWVPHEARVLDLGCGEGELLDYLINSKQIQGYGLEISNDCIAKCVSKGVSVIEQNFDEGLENFPTGSFDLVLLTSTLQAARRPDTLVEEMLRIGEKAIITFPSFSNWRHRVHLLLRGTMPVSKFLPYQWYNTPNIHLCTIQDFEILCQNHKWHIIDRYIDSGGVPFGNINIFSNFWGKRAMYLLEK